MKSFQRSSFTLAKKTKIVLSSQTPDSDESTRIRLDQTLAECADTWVLHRRVKKRCCIPISSSPSRFWIWNWNNVVGFKFGIGTMQQVPTRNWNWNENRPLQTKSKPVGSKPNPTHLHPYTHPINLTKKSFTNYNGTWTSTQLGQDRVRVELANSARTWLRFKTILLRFFFFFLK